MRTRAGGAEWGELFAENAKLYGPTTHYGDPSAHPSPVRTSASELTHALARVSVYADTNEEILAMLTQHLPGYAYADFTNDVEYRMDHTAPGQIAYVIAGSDEDTNLPYVEYARPL